MASDSQTKFVQALLDAEPRRPYFEHELALGDDGLYRLGHVYGGHIMVVAAASAKECYEEAVQQRGVIIHAVAWEQYRSDKGPWQRFLKAIRGGK